MVNYKRISANALALAVMASVASTGSMADRGTTHTPTSVTTTRDALGLAASADDATVRLAARAWCQGMVRGGGRISRIDVLSGGKIRCWYKG